MPYVVRNASKEDQIIVKRNGETITVKPDEIVELDIATAKSLASGKLVRVMPDSPDYPRS